MGGLFGYAKGALITDVGLENLRVSGHWGAGGLVGELEDSAVYRCYAEGHVYSPHYAGGLVGNLLRSTITDSYANGHVSSGGAGGAGGLVGYMNGSTVSNAYAAKQVHVLDDGGFGGDAAGGLVAVSDASTVSRSYWDVECSEQLSSAGGVGKTTAQMMQQGTYTSWDFTNTWTIQPSNRSIFHRYPRLLSFLSPHLQVSQEPPTGVATGAPFDVQFTARKANGTVHTGFNGNVTIALEQNFEDATLAGVLTVKAVDGVANFRGLTLDKPGISYVLLATASGLESALTNPFSAYLDLEMTGLSWNNLLLEKAVRFTYRLDQLPSPSTVAFFWASGDTPDTVLNGVPFISQATATSVGSHADYLPFSDISAPPAEAKYLIAAIDPDDDFAETYEDNNFKALKIANVRADSIGWNNDPEELTWVGTRQRNRINYQYTIEGARYSDPVPGRFYWSTYSLNDPPMTAANWRQFVVGFAPSPVVNLKKEPNSYSQKEPAYNWGAPPTEATGVLLVLDPDDTLFESNEDDNFVFLSMHSAAEILHDDGNNAVTFAQVGDAGISATFRPGGGLYTLAEAETRFGVDHFNWIQWVTVPENWQPVTLGNLDYGRWLDDGLIVTAEGLVAYADNGVPLASQYAIDRTFLDPIVHAQPGQTVTSATRAFIITQSDGTRRVMVWPNDNSADISLAIEDRKLLRDAPQPDDYWFYHREWDNASWESIPANADAYTLRFGDAPEQLDWAFLSSERPWLAFSTHLVGVKVGGFSWISFLGVDPTIPTGFTWSSDRNGIREIAYAGGNPNRTLGAGQGGILSLAPATSFPSYAPPTSSVAALPTKSFTQFEVSWAGTADPATGGIAVYSVYFSDNGGPFEPLVENTTATSALFTGQHGHTYSFFSIASDRFGQVQTTLLTPQLTTVYNTPVQPTTAVALRAISRSNTNPAGTAVSKLLADAANADGSLPAGVAVIGSTGNGVWQYSINNGVAWTSFGSLSAAAARLLRNTDLVRFVPKSTFVGVATISYRAWDATTGNAGDIVDLSDSAAVGGLSAYSSAARNATIAVGVARLVRLGFITQPPPTTKLGVVMPVIRVQLLDQYGQPFKKASQLVTITLVFGKSKKVYQAYTNANGIAVFRSIVPSWRGAARLIARSTGLFSAISNPFQVV